MTETPDRAEIDRAIERVQQAALRFDEVFTAMASVQRQLLGLTRGLDADAVAELDRGEATDLLGKLAELAIVLEDIHRFRTPARSVGAGQPVYPPQPRLSMAEEHQLMRDALAERPLHRGDVTAIFRAVSHRKGFPLLAELLEALDREDAIGQVLPVLKIGDLLAGMTMMGPRRAGKILAHAELPVDITFEDLGPADVQRLVRTLLVFADGIPRDL